MSVSPRKAKITPSINWACSFQKALFHVTGISTGLLPHAEPPTESVRPPGRSESHDSAGEANSLTESFKGNLASCRSADLFFSSPKSRTLCLSVHGPVTGLWAPRDSSTRPPRRRPKTPSHVASELCCQNALDTVLSMPSSPAHTACEGIPKERSPNSSRSSLDWRRGVGWNSCPTRSSRDEVMPPALLCVCGELSKQSGSRATTYGCAASTPHNSRGHPSLRLWCK